MSEEPLLTKTRSEKSMLAMVEKSALPSFASFATSINDWAAGNLAEFFHQDELKWPEPAIPMGRLWRRMQKEYTSRIIGDSSWQNSLEKIMYATAFKKKLISALQAAELVLSEINGEPSFFHCFQERAIEFGTGLKGENVTDQCLTDFCPCDVDVLELLKMMSLFLFTSLPPYMSAEPSHRIIQGRHDDDNDPGLSQSISPKRIDNGEREHKRRFREPPWSPGSNDAIAKLTQRSESVEAIRTVWGIDAAWLGDDMNTTMQLISHTGFFLKILPKYEGASFQVRSMGAYKHFLANLIATLKNQIDIANSVQSKVLSVASTLAFAGVQVAFHYYRQRYAAYESHAPVNGTAVLFK